jgi:hypothetical protein
MKNQLYRLSRLNLLNLMILKYLKGQLHHLYQKKHYYHLNLMFLKKQMFQIQQMNH